MEFAFLAIPLKVKPRLLVKEFKAAGWQGEEIRDLFWWPEIIPACFVRRERNILQNDASFLCNLSLFTDSLG